MINIQKSPPEFSAMSDKSSGDLISKLMKLMRNKWPEKKSHPAVAKFDETWTHLTWPSEVTTNTVVKSFELPKMLATEM